MIKRIRFVRRHPEVAPGNFAARWRDWSQLVRATSGTGPVRLAHCVVRSPRPGDWDGVAIEWLDGADSAAAWDRSLVAAVGRVRPPLGRSEAIEVEERTVEGEAWLSARWASTGGAPTPVLIGCIEARPGMSRPEFRDYWWDRHRPLANRLVPPGLGPVAYVHDYVRPGQPGRWAGIGELYESSLGTARRRGDWFGTEAAAELIADEERFLVRDTRVVMVADYETVPTG